MPSPEAFEVATLAGVVLSIMIAGFSLPIAALWAVGRLSDRRITALWKRVRQYEELEDWPAASLTIEKVLRLLRKKQPTPDVLVGLANALDDQATFVGMLGDDDAALRLQQEAYRVAATVDGVPRHDLAGLAFQLGAALCGQRQGSEATYYLDLAFAGADPGSDLSVMARMEASVALRRCGQVSQALEVARDAVRLAEAVSDEETRVWLRKRTRMTLAMALADAGQDGKEAAEQVLNDLGEADSEFMLARACYVNGYVAGTTVDTLRHALRAKEIILRLEQRSPGRYRDLQSDVEELLEKAHPA